MKQILQNLKSGETLLEDIPCPRILPRHVLIRTHKTLISAGTEKMLVDFGKANLIDKARQQPDKVKMVLDKVKTDGLAPTIETVRNKLDQALPMGYCNVGTVLEVGVGVAQFKVGDRVASNGKHAEVVCVPENLCMAIPDSVTDEAAAFTVLGAIALQGIRLINPTLGETVVVTGLGLIGLVTVQLLKAQGCRVIGIDLDSDKVELAKTLGAETVNLSKGENPITIAEQYSRGRGVDAVIITASAKNNEIVHQAALMCRKRGRIVLVGVVGLELSRADFYEKELSFQVSCSYGPGRYDPEYEEVGKDYPLAFVRWTEQRNFEAVLDMIADGKLDTEVLVSHRFTLDKAVDAYEVVGDKGSSLGIILQFPEVSAKSDAELQTRTIKLSAVKRKAGSASKATVGFIGSGNYATAVLIPAFAKANVQLMSVASSAGISSVHAGKKFGFAAVTTDSQSIIEDSAINTIVVTTRHNNHAQFVCDALNAGKHVFVEKPLALKREELADISLAYDSAAEQGSPLVMVGFNRRFSPHVQKIKQLLGGVSEPKSFIMTVNAGAIPSDHWTQDKEVGGGRIIGEGCHFIDLLRFLADAPIVSVQAMMLGEGVAIRDDKVTITLGFADGSFGVVHYLANGSKSFPKERLEVFCADRVLQLDNFRKLTGFGWPGFTKLKTSKQDKGQQACAAAFVAAIENGGESPIPFAELLEVAHATFDVVDILEKQG
ncbi:MAG: dehydrogenase [Methyloprofundus sp.]|nr:MAG: dehydrogenase [Methyloprofundus sp.]